MEAAHDRAVPEPGASVKRARRLAPGAIATVALLSLAPAVRADDTASPVRIDLDGSILFGPVSGFAQIPRAGAPGSTTPRMPTLDQIGIDEVTAEDFQLEAGYGGPGVYGGAHFTHLTGSSVLAAPLTSQGVDFLAGTEVRGYLKLDWYRLGAEWALPEARPTIEYPFSIRPGIGFVLLSAAYRLQAAGPSADRSFTTGAPEVMLDGEWMAIGPLSFAGRFSSTLPFPKLPWVLTVEARARLRLFGDDPEGSGLTLLGSGAQGGFVFVGVALDVVLVDDRERPVSNEIQALMGPLFVGGIELRY
jgi:hypothetical protein